MGQVRAVTGPVGSAMTGDGSMGLGDQPKGLENGIGLRSD